LELGREAQVMKVLTVVPLTADSAALSAEAVDRQPDDVKVVIEVNSP
jgi:hypothetical protein